MSRPVLLDCDPGHDDAIAIMLAAADPGIDLRLVTTVAGNVTLENTTRNALRVLDMVDRPDIPVAAGCDRPRVRALSTAASMHGDSGLAGPELAEPSRSALDAPAIEVIEQFLIDADEPLTLVATGALTNMADVVERLPHLRDRIDQLVIMGGAVDLGNWTPAAEFNIWVDPHAADVVFRAARVPGTGRPDDGIALTMIGLEVTHRAWLADEHADALRGTGRAGRWVAELLDHFVGFHQDRFGWEGGPIHDAVTIAHLIDPTLVTTLPMNVRIETESPLCIGRTVADRWQVTGLPANAAVGLDIDRDRFVTLLMDRLSSLA
ncbi:MAG: pyrimidine-specific ribonucleoside hydrolase RihA [Actinomycetales bacterium]|nr:pyrimidine-specific ribonucleoside hydrolase RihA [Actinomycetales bacterium]